MRIVYNEYLNKRLLPYMQQLVKNKTKLDKENTALFDAFQEYLDLDACYGAGEKALESYINDTIEKEKIQSVANLFDGKLKAVLVYILGDEYARLFHTYLKLRTRCPYTYGSSRHSQRSDNPALHLDHILDTLKQFLRLRATGFSKEILLNGGKTPEDTQSYKDSINFQDWIAAHIAEGDQTVINHISNVLTSENNANRLNRAHLQAIAISGYAPLLELERKLLLAAKLQEGLRQVIIETMDEGCPESYIYLFSVIYENGLQRFASVKRGIAVCTGLGEQDSSDRITNKYIELIHTFLLDQNAARKATQSQDTTELYLALWSIGFYDIKNIQTLIPEIIQKDSKYQVETLLHFMRCTQYPIMSHRISKDALEIWYKEPEVVASILPLYMGGMYLSRYGLYDEAPALKDYFDSEEEAIRQYGYLKQVHDSISTQETYAPYVFLWESITLTRSDVVLKMAYITWVTNNSALKDDLCTYLPELESYMRSGYIGVVLNPPTSPLQEEYVLQSLGDRSAEVREEANKALSHITLTPEQNQKVEELLRFKYSEMRINAINLLMKQPKDQLKESIRRLLTNKVTERRLAGLDMMKTIHTTEAMQDIYQELLDTVRRMQKPNAKEKVLIESLIGNGTETTVLSHYTKENGFGLYDPAMEINLPEIAPDKGFNVKKTFEFISFGRAKLAFEKLNKLITLHQYEVFLDDYGEDRLIGDCVLMKWSKCGGVNTLGHPYLWVNFYRQEIGSYDKLLMMYFLLHSTGASTDSAEYEEDEEDRKANLKSSGVFEPLVNKMYGGVPYQGLQRSIRKLPYYKQIEDIIDALIYEYSEESIYQRIAANMLLQLLPLLNTHNVFRQYTSKHTWIQAKKEYGEKQVVYPIQNNKFVQFWLQMPRKPMDNALFTRYFTVRYQLYKLTNYMEHTPEPEETNTYLYGADFVRAWALGLIPTEEVYRELMGRISSPSRIKEITLAMNPSHRPLYEDKDWYAYIKGGDLSIFRPLIKKVIDRILEIELKRGDSETQVTRLAESLNCIYGAETFIRILQAFGKDTFIRDSYNWGSTKRGVLSSLLHACYPLPTDTSKLLKKLAKQAQIADERLVEAAMFAPQWIELTEKAIGWKGLTSAAYYFHAHTNQTCDEKKRAIIARYTPIDVEDLQEGAFDIEWFKDAYQTLGKQRFEVVYNAAKYISCSNSHTRARKFADATSGAVEAADVKKEIIAKRNKDLVMSYGLIPLGRKRDKDLLERYQYLQQFLKESKQFGAQRQESEKKAVNIALLNLARNSGYGDVTRLTWSMETELIKELVPYLTPKVINGVEMYVEVGEDGKCEIKLRKDGKALNSIPTLLKKHPYVEELKTVHKKLKDQYNRSRVMLEQSMEDCIYFEESEVCKLMKNPVIWPLLKNLVFTCNGQMGFYAEGQLVTANGTCIDLKAKDKLRIAHPLDLYASGEWHTYQKLLFDRNICQPFKQVFRELYIPTDEEADATQSHRYAGNQIQPQKTVAVLKGRRWVADFEEGLQKIYYKENIIAVIYAMANWFSPADIEAPTLEYVCFYNRKDFRPMKISEVPPVIFSEVMRDVDMAVSVAHVGSVDPETSHSTIEMRSALVELTMPLLHLDNVMVKGNFAYIKGKLGEYHIHLGSGVIHQEGGAQIAVLPVHSENRERLFLPFVDEDPKTAEILTKIIFFAEDDKIKDTSILKQIK